MVLFSLAGSQASRSFAIDPGPVAPIASFALVVIGALIVASGFGSWARVGMAALIGLASELAGVHTGFPFGAYAYTSAWQPVVPVGNSHVLPLALPMAWLMMAGASYLLAQRWLAGWKAMAAGAAGAALIDLCMEPAMVEGFGYWRWLQPGPLFGVPVTNLLGWFAVSLAANFALGQTRAQARTLESLAVLLGFSLVVIFANPKGPVFPHLWPIVAILVILGVLLQRNPSQGNTSA